MRRIKIKSEASLVILGWLFYVAVGHSGITLSPIHGKVISDLIVDGRTGYDIADYDPLRFDPA